MNMLRMYKQMCVYIYTYITYIHTYIHTYMSLGCLRCSYWQICASMLRGESVYTAFLGRSRSLTCSAGVPTPQTRNPELNPNPQLPKS